MTCPGPSQLLRRLSPCLDGLGLDTYKVTPSHDWPFGAGCGLEAPVPLYMSLSVRLLESAHGIVATFCQNDDPRNQKVEAAIPCPVHTLLGSHRVVKGKGS